MLNGLDLFSGIGGISLALSPWVKPLAYCEIDPYARAVLMSRMRDGGIKTAPIWDDVTTLIRGVLPGDAIDIITGGFPCQDISVAGNGAGLAGERSGLFFEILRLTRELRPRFIFLENVPAIAVRGLDRVCLELTTLGYDCRWTIVSAAEMGAPHLRERWFLLAHSRSNGIRDESNKQSWSDGRTVAPADGEEKSVANSDRLRKSPGSEEWYTKGNGAFYGCETVADSHGSGFKEQCRASPNGREFLPAIKRSSEMAHPSSARWDPQGIPISGETEIRRPFGGIGGSSWWAAEPNVGRVAHGIPQRMDRLRGLGNAVVPAQAREAFERLMGL